MDDRLRREVFTTAAGVVTLQWPEEITAAEVDELDEWLELLKKKIRRTAKPRPIGFCRDE